ncbi:MULTISPECIES: hypothetical protein [unclassified Nocardioides]|uniref:hypothetical protein n=1 Tax=unclassified Nocardioides TaxID=2615069 RepID=UPI0006FEE43D|nr:MULTISPECIES: hypothetical protein [unclassified Nocardioides]KQY63927.1 hypothetical protein ASD30_02805 [Nocardioides sp. Root140]KQZ69845.1 hypothetical protein ASD66_09050 [Nocardioides sp. Root151]KRF15941.1 hypothetical protein ASH02_04810 [Nocardioides sp. Soil796]
MTDGDDTRPGSTPGPDDVGSVADEAAKLFGALSGWARTHGADLGAGVGDLAGAAAHAAHDVNEHLATGAAECTYCPICRAVHVVRELSPEVKNHLAVAGASLMHAAAALMASAVPDDAKKRDDGVEHIDLDADWPED